MSDAHLKTMGVDKRKMILNNTVHRAQLLGKLLAFSLVFDFGWLAGLISGAVFSLMLLNQRHLQLGIKELVLRAVYALAGRGKAPLL